MAAVEKAEAEKIAVVKAAEGDAESKYLQGQVSLHQHLTGVMFVIMRCSVDLHFHRF